MATLLTRAISPCEASTKHVASVAVTLFAVANLYLIGWFLPGQLTCSTADSPRANSPRSYLCGPTNTAQELLVSPVGIEGLGR